MGKLSFPRPGGKQNLEKLEDKYEIGRKLGSGHYATVKLAVNKETGQECAAKLMSKERLGSAIRYVQTEIRIMRTVEHPNLVKLYDVFETKDQIALVMELVPGGELFEHICDNGPYSEKDAARLVRAILKALKICHDRGIVHRDLKPENFLLTGEADLEKSVRIADWGLSKILDKNELMRTSCGTPGYVAPEIVVNQPYDAKCDIYSMGCILYVLLVGYPPFFDENITVVLDKIQRGSWTFQRPWWDPISPEAKDLVRRMMALRPEDRPTAAEALEHSFLAGEAGSDEPIPNIQENIEKFNAKRKFKKGVLTVMAGKRMSLLQRARNAEKSAAKSADQAGKAEVSPVDPLA